MGTIKIEFDLPEFKDNLELNIVIRKDGEVLATSSSSSSKELNFPEVGGPSSEVSWSTETVGSIVNSLPNNEVTRAIPADIPKSMVDINI